MRRRRTAAGRAGRRRGGRRGCQPTSAPSTKAIGSSIGLSLLLEAEERGELRLLARQRPVGVAEAIARPAQAVEPGGLRRLGAGRAPASASALIESRPASRMAFWPARAAGACRSASAIAVSYWPVPSASAARCTPACAVRTSSAPQLAAEELVGLRRSPAPPPPGRGAGSSRPSVSSDTPSRWSTGRISAAICGREARAAPSRFAARRVARQRRLDRASPRPATPAARAWRGQAAALAG